MPIRDEITHALSIDWTYARGCCLPQYAAITALRAHGVHLLNPVEEIVPALDVPTGRTSSALRSNLHRLLEMYFELADDHDHDPTGFVMSLSAPAYGIALQSIQFHWGTNHNFRRRSIWRSF